MTSEQPPQLRPFWREPIVLFAAIGSLLFVLDTCWGSGDEVEVPVVAEVSNTIVVPKAFIDAKRAEIASKTNKPVTQKALQAAARGYVREEALIREALRNKMHQSDLVVRRRLLQKMEFILEDLAVVEEPSQEELTAWFEERGERYATPARFSFEHQYFSRDSRANPKEDAQKAREQLMRNGDALPTDQFLRGRRFRKRTQPEIARVFGTNMAGSIPDLRVGVWSEPIASPYGQHLVLLSDVVPSKPAELGAMKQQVLQDLMSHRKKMATQQRLEEIIRTYDIQFEEPWSDSPTQPVTP